MTGRSLGIGFFFELELGVGKSGEMGPRNEGKGWFGRSQWENKGGKNGITGSSHIARLAKAILIVYSPADYPTRQAKLLVNIQFRHVRWYTVPISHNLNHFHQISRGALSCNFQVRI